MSDYPEHDKMSAVVDQTEAAAAFVEWLGTQRIQLMQWRDDMTDLRMTSPICTKYYASAPAMKGKECRAKAHGDHCAHWDGPGLATCCQCGQPNRREVTGIEAWVPAGSLTDLLAKWQDIDMAKIDAEKRAMIERLREGR